LVISDMGRNDKKVPLVFCSGAYYEFPKDVKPADYNRDVWRYNVDELQKNPPSGMAMAELLAAARPDLFADRQRPRIVFYTSSSGGRAANWCARTITNRPEVFLESVVSALASFRADKLPDITQAETGEGSSTQSSGKPSTSGQNVLAPKGETHSTIR
jgi:hypothetical protein